MFFKNQEQKKKDKQMRWKQKTEQKEMGEEPEKLHLDWITIGDSRLQRQIYNM